MGTVSPPVSPVAPKPPYFIDYLPFGHHSNHQNGYQIGHQMHSLRRAYAPFRLHWIKGKYYLSVSAPKEIAHFYREGRVRRSTRISDRKLAELRAQEIVPAIYRGFDEKFDQLDPFVEGLRHLLEREGVDVGQWYREGQITARVSGYRTSLASWIDLDRLKCQRRSKNRPRGGAKPGQWRGVPSAMARALFR
jgi:hypothetical protein